MEFKIELIKPQMISCLHCQAPDINLMCEKCSLPFCGSQCREINVIHNNICGKYELYVSVLANNKEQMRDLVENLNLRQLHEVGIDKSIRFYMLLNKTALFWYYALKKIDPENTLSFSRLNLDEYQTLFYQKYYLVALKNEINSKTIVEIGHYKISTNFMPKNILKIKKSLFWYYAVQKISNTNFEFNAKDSRKYENEFKRMFLSTYITKNDTDETILLSAIYQGQKKTYNDRLAIQHILYDHGYNWLFVKIDKLLLKLAKDGKIIIRKEFDEDFEQNIQSFQTNIADIKEFQ